MICNPVCLLSVGALWRKKDSQTPEIDRPDLGSLLFPQSLELEFNLHTPTSSNLFEPYAADVQSPTSPPTFLPRSRNFPPSLPPREMAIFPNEISLRIVDFIVDWNLRELAYLARVNKLFLAPMRARLNQSLELETYVEFQDAEAVLELMRDRGMYYDCEDKEDDLYDKREGEGNLRVNNNVTALLRSLRTYPHLTQLVKEVNWKSRYRGTGHDHRQRGDFGRHGLDKIEAEALEDDEGKVLEAVKEVVELLDACPQVVILKLKTDWWLWTSQVAHELSRSQIGRSLKVFTWDGADLWADVVEPWPYQEKKAEHLAGMFASMKGLEVLNLGKMRGNIYWEEGVHPTFKLRNFASRDGQSARIINNLLHHSSTSLLHLDISLRDDLTTGIVNELVSAVRLRFTCPAPPVGITSALPMMSKCPRIETLIFASAGSKARINDYDFIQRIPSTVRRLVLDRISLPVSILTDLLASSSVFEVDHRRFQQEGHDGRTPPQWTPEERIAFMSMCEAKGIALRSSSGGFS